MDYVVALFGEAEKGRYQTAYHCCELGDLAQHLGEPTEDGRGLNFAIQTLLYQHQVVFFRVQNEGFSTEDYLFGLNFLKKREKFPKISALCLPGVGDRAILDATTPICSLYKSFLIITESDLYDFLTNT
ncbi:MAG: hypothetical protein H7A36_00215 [Chlamydiales bacterium]|nr:hypothetical protein [Chlamydiales bacterium]